MRKIVKLGNFIEECPDYWNNFVESQFEKSGRLVDNFTVTKGLSSGTLNKELDNFNAIYLSSKRHLMFASEEDFAMFCLKYS